MHTYMKSYVCIYKKYTHIYIHIYIFTYIHYITNMNKYEKVARPLGPWALWALGRAPLPAGPGALGAYVPSFWLN